MPGTPDPAPAAGARGSPPDPLAVMRTPAYLRLQSWPSSWACRSPRLAFGFLKLTGSLQQWAFTDLPQALGFASAAGLVAAGVRSRWPGCWSG